jgi:hypothetical protein
MEPDGETLARMIRHGSALRPAWRARRWEKAFDGTREGSRRQSGQQGNRHGSQALQGGRIVQIQGGDADVPAFSIELVTPDSATELLQRKRPSAAENPAAIAAYAEAMREGRWILNGMPLILSRAGVLLDGVQRLRACIKAGVPFLTVLAQNIPDDVLHTIDQQRRRSFAGVLETRGIPHAHALQSGLGETDPL